MLSVVIITKNEAKNIKRCLESVLWADEIIVLDSSSTDKTIEIAQQFTKKVFSTPSEDWLGYGVQKQRALAYATGDWVLNLDADECLTPTLQQVIQSAIRSDRYDAYRIPIHMCFYNKPLRYSSSPTRHIRLFKRVGAQYSSDIVHEKINLSIHSRVGQLQTPIMHHSFQDLSHALYKMNKYSSSSARIRLANHKKTTLFKTILGSSWMFFRCYILQRGCLEGASGFILAVLQAQGTFYRGIKQLYPDSQWQDPQDHGR